MFPGETITHKIVSPELVHVSSLVTASQPAKLVLFCPSGEAITHKIMSPELVRILFLVVALSMALTPLLAEAGAKLSKAFDKGDMKV